MASTPPLTAAHQVPKPGGMIALIPESPGMLTVEGGDPEDEMHLTLAYLGDNVAEDHGPEIEAAITRDIGRYATAVPPVAGQVFGHAIWRPESDSPAAVHQLEGSAELEQLRNEAVNVAREQIGAALMPTQHEQFLPHVTAGYGIPVDRLSYTGPVRFTTLRVQWGADRHDYPLLGEPSESQGAIMADGSNTQQVPVEFPALVLEGVETGDGRYIEPGALTHRALPLHILAQTQNPVGGGGHDGAYVVGQLDTLERVPGPEVVSRETGEPFPEGVFVWRGSGWVNPNAEGASLVTGEWNAETDSWEGGVLMGNSADLTEMDAELSEDGRANVVAGKISATTMVPIPAFAESYVVVGGTPSDRPEAEAMAASGVAAWRSSDLGDDVCLPCAMEDESWDSEPDLEAPGLVASVTELLPPAAMLTDPQFTQPTPHTIDDPVNGWRRVYGHLAAWDTCHTGFPGQCRTAPRSATGYSFFRLGARRAAGPDGPVEVPVGHITMGIGHAETSGPRASMRSAIEHYDNTDAVVADIACGEDAHGIWYSGVIRPGLSDERVEELRAASLSGDWRPVQGGGMELCAALAVNVPGFPVTRAMVASGAPSVLIAAAQIASPHVPESNVVLDYDALADAISDRMEARSKRRDEDDEDEERRYALSMRARRAGALLDLEA